MLFADLLSLQVVTFLMFFCLGTGVPRHSAGGVGTFVRTYVRGTYRLQCACASNGSREQYHSYYIIVAVNTYLQH